MSKIEEMALKAYPKDVVGYEVKTSVGYKPTELDYNEDKRKAYILGAKAVLNEIEKYADAPDCNSFLDSILMMINEMKG